MTEEKRSARERFQGIKGAFESKDQGVGFGGIRFLIQALETAVELAAKESCHSDFDCCAKDHVSQVWQDIDDAMERK